MSWPQTSLEAVATARSYDDPPPRDFESIELSCDTVNSLTLLGLGLIKINDVSANFNNPRHSLILNN